jgi:hypothetical protein
VFALGFADQAASVGVEVDLARSIVDKCFSSSSDCHMASVQKTETKMGTCNLMSAAERHVSDEAVSGSLVYNLNISAAEKGYHSLLFFQNVLLRERVVSNFFDTTS